ncbi:MAG: hypothetical protein ACM3NO_03490, partial [Deltaproteobacteria bacterium]
MRRPQPSNPDCGASYLPLSLPIGKSQPGMRRLLRRKQEDHEPLVKAEASAFQGERTMKTSPLAGKPAEPSGLVDIAKLVTAYFTKMPDPAVPEQRVTFGTSGHRGSAFEKAFNEGHILAISQAICLYRKQHQIDGPSFLGMDTHALSVPALTSALEVLAANGVE